MSTITAPNVTREVAEGAASTRTEAEVRAQRAALHPVMAQVLRGIVPAHYLTPAIPDPLLTADLYLIEAESQGIKYVPEPEITHLTSEASAREHLRHNLDFATRVILIAANGQRSDVSARFARLIVKDLYAHGDEPHEISANAFIGRHVGNDDVERICDPDGWAE